MRTRSVPDADDPIADLVPLTRDILHEQVYAVLKRNMMIGNFKPGQKLVLRKLAHSLGTSLVPVRDALQRLESVGCVVSTPGRTMAIPVFTDKQLEDISRVRISLEGLSVRFAAVNRTDAQLQDLRRHCAEIRAAARGGNVDRFLEANYHFHMAIAEASRIEFLPSLLEPLWMRIGPYVRSWTPGKAHIERAAHCHEVTLAAIRLRDRQAAYDGMIADICECNGFPLSLADAIPHADPA